MSTGAFMDRFSRAAIPDLMIGMVPKSEISPGLSATTAIDLPGLPAMTFGEFVQFRFVPEYVASRNPSVQSHFYAVLKYVLTPQRVADAFGMERNESRRSLRRDAQRPYMDDVPLSTITAEEVAELMSEYLKVGYAGQTVAHIRNALRIVFGFAAACGCYSGTNPAKDVPIPNIARKPRQLLALNDIKMLIAQMRYPEREIALITLITGIHVTEVCGLQWKYVNLSNSARLVEGELLPPRALAIRNQGYRGVFGPVSERRRQTISIGSQLASVLRELMHRERFIASDDFVLCSRNGTPVNPDNIALRRLKPIGATLQMPWLSWKVFRNSRASLMRQLGKLWSEQLTQAPSSRQS